MFDSTAELAEALSRSATAAQAAGVSFEELLALLRELKGGNNNP